jgi:hypothetical protein
VRGTLPRDSTFDTFLHSPGRDYAVSMVLSRVIFPLILKGNTLEVDHLLLVLTMVLYRVPARKEYSFPFL